MADQEGGKLVYEVDIETAGLIEGSKKAKAEISSLGDEVGKTAPSFDKMSKSAKSVSTALVMPEVNKLSTQLAQLSGKIGANSESAIEASVAQNKFSGALSTAAGKLGAGYVSNVGSATASLLKHAQGAIAATNAQMENAIAAQKEAIALQGSASQLVITATEEKKLAEAAAQTAQSELLAAEAIFTRKQTDIESLEAILTRQKESLRQSEANLEISNSEKAVADAVRARSAVEATQAKILKQSNQAVKEVTTAEDKLVASKSAATAASAKLTQATALEAIALQTSAKANEAAAIASDQLTLAAKAQAVAITGARSALALLGGPAGVLLLAAAGVYALYQAMSDKQDIEQYKRDIDEAARKVQFLTKVQADAVAAKSRIKIDIDKRSLEEANTALSELRNRLSTATRFNADPKDIIDLKNQVEVAAGAVDKYSDAVRVGEERLAKFSKQSEAAGDTTSAQASANEVYYNSMKGLISSNELLETSIRQSMSAAEEAAAETSLREALKNIGAGVVETTDKVAALHAEFAKKRSLTFEEMLKGVEQNVKALKIEMSDGVIAAAAYRAEIALAKQGITDPKEIKKYTDAVRDQAKAQLELSNSKKQSSANKSSGLRDAKAAETIAQKLANLKQQSELAADSTRELSREQAILTAQQSLGSAATQKDIELAGKYAAAKWDTGNAIRAQAAAEKLIAEKGESSRYEQETKDLNTALSARKISQEQYDKASEKSEQEHQTNLAKIRSDAVVSPQQEAAGSVDPVQQLANENAKKLALIQQFETNKTITEQQGLELRRAANKQYEQERTDAMFALWSQQTIGNQVLAASIESFSQAASGALSGVITGTQSASDAMRGLADTVLNSVIQTFVEMGLQQVKSAIMGATAQQAAIAATTTAQVAGISTQTAASTTAAVATTAAWTPAAIMSSVASFGGAVAIGLGAMAGIMALSGKRKNGGPVSAGGMYQVGEGGMPEIYQSSSGRQYMIPGDNGSVISNKDMQGNGNGGTGGVIVNINNYTPATVDMQQSTSPSGGITVDVFIADMNAGGPMSQSITSNTSATRRANNQ